MALLAQEFAEDAKEVEHFMTDARNPPDDVMQQRTSLETHERRANE